MSAYATPDDVRLAANPQWAPGSPEQQAAAQDASALDDDQLNAAIAQASSRVDSYIGARYQTPVAPLTDGAGAPLTPLQYPDAQVKFWTVDVALFLATLTYLRSIPMESTDPVWLRYQSTLADLTSVRDGKSVMALPPAASGDASQSAGGAGIVDPGSNGIFDAADAGYHRGILSASGRTRWENGGYLYG